MPADLAMGGGPLFLACRELPSSVSSCDREGSLLLLTEALTPNMGLHPYALI